MDEFKRLENREIAERTGRTNPGFRLPRQNHSKGSKRDPGPFATLLEDARLARRFMVTPEIAPAGRAGRPKNETAVKELIHKEWSRYRTPEGRERYVIHAIESANVPGIPDWLVHDTLFNNTCWIETKFLKLPLSWPGKTDADLGLRPEQATWLWSWRRDGGNAAVVAYTDRGWWIFMPARSWTEWPQRMSAKGVWLVCPWIIGSGPLPSPPELFSLSADNQLFYNFKQPSPDHYFKAIAWPSEPRNREGDRLKTAMVLESNHQPGDADPEQPTPSKPHTTSTGVREVASR